MPFTGKALIVAGVILIALGVLVSFGPKIPYLGRLPGDSVVRRENFTLYVPLATCILLSILVTLFVRFFGK